MENKYLVELVADFVEGLLKKAKCNHAGNCLAVSRVLKSYLFVFFGVDTELIHVWVHESKTNIVNHYCLRKRNGDLIDATASQFSDMPKVYIGKKPKKYQLTNDRGNDGKQNKGL